MKHRLLACVTSVALCAGAAAAQAPDCTGISVAHPVSGTDYVNQLTMERIASGFSSPVLVTSAPGDFEHLYVVERAGTIDVVADGTVLPTPFLDIDFQVTGSSNGSSAGEQGLLGMAFHPDYQSNGWFFVYFTDTSGNMRVVRYTATSPTAADAGSAAPVISINQPFGNHNGGTIAFGPLDGELYIGTGDGGSGCDPGNRAQDITGQTLGKMLRINVDALPYTVPSANPFVGSAGDDEIWSYGLRNPFRFSFDRIHGTLLIGDVGQNTREEVDCTPAGTGGGQNYGWKNYEANICPSCGAGTCLISDYSPPVFDYPTANGDSVIGGYVYRGCRMPELHGTYFFGNYNWNNSANDLNTEMLSFRVDESTCGTGPLIDRKIDLKSETPANLVQRLAGFGEDQRGELYFVDQFDGELYKLLPNLRLMEVSGQNAVPLTMGPADWSWEDFEAVAGYQLDSYKVYRADGAPTGPFACVQQTSGPLWSGGDTAVPSANGVYYYLVRAVDGNDASYAGFASDGSPRPVQGGSVCPP